MQDTTTNELVSIIEDAFGLPHQPSRGPFLVVEQPQNEDRLVDAINRLTNAISGALDPEDEENKNFSVEEQTDARRRVAQWKKRQIGGSRGA